MENATVVGMVIPMPKAAAAAPNTATDVQAQFTDASTSGTISFKAPETQFDGTALASGTTLSYIVTADISKSLLVLSLLEKPSKPPYKYPKA